MASGSRNQLAGQIGEHLVVAELGRRGIIAAPFAGNVPDIDVLAYYGGRSIPLQVKAMRQASGSVRADRYLKIRFDGEMQIIDGLVDTIQRALIYVVVMIGDRRIEDRFFIFEQGDLQDMIHKTHADFLRQHSGRRPKNWQSVHCSYNPHHFIGAEENWPLIERRLGVES